MAGLPQDLDLLDLATLVGLVEAQASESVTLEFKSAPYGPSHDDTREFLKDVSALANTAGGMLLIGVREEGGVAAGLQPIQTPDADQMQQRLHSLLQSALEPRVFGVQMKAIPADKGYILAIRVPRSPAPPHRVTSKNSNRFYLRASAGVYEASYDELRTMFLQTSAAADRIAAFRRDRLKLLEADAGPVVLADGADRLVLHIMPLSNTAGAVDLTVALERSELFRPLGSTGWTPRFNLDGFINTRGGGHCHGYTQVFRDGQLEATSVGYLNVNGESRRIPGRQIERLLLEHAPVYVRGLQAAGVNPPLFVALSLQGAHSAVVTCSDYGLDDPPTPLRVDDLMLPICVIDDFGSDDAYRAALKPALDALWNAGGYSEWAPLASGRR
ncbi:hypothetical protein BH10PSE4_BH10PSE4_34140 [soil metagenome]